VIGVLVIAVLAGIGAYLLLSRDRPDPAPPPEAPPAPVPDPQAAPPPAPEPTPAPAAAPAAPQPPLDEQRIRELAGALSDSTEWSRWLARPHLLGKLVAAVETVASGGSPRKVLPFLAPEGRFATIERGGREIIDPAGYQRYDPLAAALTSLDTEGLAALYRRLEPRLDERYRELGRPGQRFRDALGRAMAELLAVPAVEAEVPLERIEVTLEIDVPQLEAMSEAQKHLFRMGPDNVRRIQAKLRQIAAALGLQPAIADVEPIRCAICPERP
jgi:hypothetical protein